MMMAAFLCNFSNARTPQPRLDFIKGTKRTEPNKAMAFLDFDEHVSSLFESVQNRNFEPRVGRN